MHAQTFRCKRQGVPRFLGIKSSFKGVKFKHFQAGVRCKKKMKGLFQGFTPLREWDFTPDESEKKA